ncbi:MMPL family transporter [Emticicia sp. CRIBPO]|uniref:efflux RND transporter permease subunit n=1 Tax=Emticicia sp. CRIBPO TaxID=2683258 RepID=UPI0014131EBC|nr:efflux RND transporter permease subunit [Emticicia sp. CRIBPO]NBA87832.1 MMPL family transporter [Emticicia sp. CRIBPO]
MSITEVAVKRPLLITVIFVTLILFGFISYKTLNYNLFPKFETNVIMVQTTYRGSASDEVESSVTKPLEDAVSSIEGVDMISSSSQEGLSLITVTLKSGFNVITAQQDAERKVNQIKAKLPDDIDDPVVSRLSLDDLPILKLSATSKMPQTELYDFIDLQVKPLLTNVAGVAQVNIIGGNEREIEVYLDNDKLQTYNISSAAINQVIAGSGVSYPAGSIKTDQTRFSLRLDAKLKKVEDIRNLVVRENPNGSRILLKDVASVTDAQTEATTLNRINGKPAIGIQIMKQTDANAVNVSKGAKEALAKMKETFKSKDFNYEVASDQSVYTLASADAVMHDLYLAIIIVGIVMVLFLHSVRSSLFVLVAIPSAMIPTFILMWLFGFSLNLMTLMALSLVVGILVDDSIVVLENIYRHLEMGKTKRQASLDGRGEIGFTAMAITLVDVVVFLPLALAGGLIGNILREFSLVIVFSTLMSLFVSFTLTPLLASRWGKLEVLKKNTLWGALNLGFERIIDNIRDLYLSLLNWALGHKRYVFIVIIALLVGTFTLLGKGFVGATFIGNADRGELSIQLDLAPETPLVQTNQLVARVESILLSKPEVVNVFSNVGTQASMVGGSSNSNLADITVTLVDKHDRPFSTDEFGQMMRDTISKIPGLIINVQPIGVSGNSQAPISIAVKGTVMDSVVKAAAMLKQIVAKTPGADYVQYSTKSPKTEVAIRVDRDKMAKLGLSIPEVGSAVQLAFQGNNNTKYKDKGEEYGINLIFDKSDKQSIENVRGLTLRNNRNAIVRLTDFATVEELVGQSILERTDRLSSIKINSAAVGRPSGTIVEDIKKELTKVKLPEGIIIDYLGDAKNQGDAFGSLGLAMGIGILLVYLIMVALYESVVYPFVVLFSIPVAIIGAILALALTMNSLSIFAILGMIMLLGLVCKNAILIVDFTNHLKDNGMPVKEALMEAGKERLRPILMTTLAMIFGMLPIALASGAGAETKNGMAWVIIGGLTSSMILTLILVPSVYMVIEGWRTKINRLVLGKKQAKAEAKLVEETAVN